MTYVMVPVPEELVPEVKQFLRWNVVGPMMGTLDIDGTARFLESLDDEARRFLLVVAEAATDTRVLTVGDAAVETGCSEREALGLMAELNTAVQFFGTLPLGLVSRDRPEDAGGPDEEPRYTFNMRADIAELVLRASGRGVAER